MRVNKRFQQTVLHSLRSARQPLTPVVSLLLSAGGPQAGGWGGGLFRVRALAAVGPRNGAFGLGPASNVSSKQGFICCKLLY
ncbi:MAG TPA: hypothetical protein ENJ35_04595 [Gammaproteobacteria bacterium]|nr:hypothetical protein [Gammaproteobacteria bacterium]